MKATSLTPSILHHGFPDDYLTPTQAKADRATLRIIGSAWGVTAFIHDRYKNGALASGAVIEVSEKGKLLQVSPSRARKLFMEKAMEKAEQL